MERNLCPHCGAPMPEMRHGVRVSNLKARIFDAVRRAGPDGISGRDLREIVGISDTSLKSHIWQINELFDDYRICGRPGRHGFRRLIRL